MKITAMAGRRRHDRARPPPPPRSLQDSIRADMPMLMNLYRDLHANPELSMQEVRTPAKLAPEMRKLGFDVTEHVGKTGLVAVMKNGPGPVLLIRADMDALAGQGADRPALRVQGDGQAAGRHRHAGDACLRPRHAHHHLARRRRAGWRR